MKKEEEKMRTELTFTDSIDKRVAILKHAKDVHFKREVRKDHLEWTDGNGNKLENREYIVITFPKNKQVDLTKIEIKRDELYSIGYKVNDLGEMMELLFYDRITFCWRLYELEKAGLCKVTQRIIPDSESGELFHYYINARGFKEYGYNIMGMLIQLSYDLYKKKREIKRTQKLG